ncbi:MAG: alpha/beta hydrolase family protein [Ktedonobacteraceae bacterium]
MSTQIKISNGVSKASKHTRKHWIFIIAIVLLVLVLLAGSIILLIDSIRFSDKILLVSDYTTPTYDTPVLAVSDTSVTLKRMGDDMHPGEFEIEWPAGQALVGPTLTFDQNSVTRQLLLKTAPLSAGTSVFWTRYVYMGQIRNSLGLPISTVQVPDSLGIMPAWYVPGKLSTWAILVHGRGASRDEALRAFTPLYQLGFPLLAISYRNDIGAPPSSDRADHLGDSEWLDLEAAVKYAIAHGAQHLVLYGWSQGGAVVEVFMHHSSLSHMVQALILDAPTLNWTDTFVYQAQLQSVPGFMVYPAELVSTIRSGINFNDLNQLNQAQPDIPILLFHGVNDTSTPVSVSDAFAKAYPDLVTYVRVPGVEHTESWNANPQVYNNELTAFLKQKLSL